jgi:soluble lytic murein transglycosylase-like protein
MTPYAFNTKRYRVTNNSKFVFSTLSLIILALTIVTIASIFIMNHIAIANEQKAQAAEQQEMQVLKEKYSFTIGNVSIEATSAEEALNKTKTLLQEQVEKNTEQETVIVALQEDYDQKIQQAKQVTKQDVNLYNEFAYAIDYPGSDITLSDIKMIVNISKEEKVNPHVWLSLVKLESNYKSNSRSNISTASGWGQVLKGTGQYLYENELQLGKYNHEKMGTNKEINARMSIHYLSNLIQERGSVEKALVSYNGGELGSRYIDIVNQNLKDNTGLTLSKISKSGSSS